MRAVWKEMEGWGVSVKRPGEGFRHQAKPECKNPPKSYLTWRKGGYQGVQKQARA